MAYDDLMGLDMYDGLDDLGAIYSAKMFQDQLIAAGSSAAAILLASWGLPKLTASDFLTKQITDETTRHRVGALIGIVGGAIASRVAWNFNRDAAMAILGGVSGLGLAQLVDSFFKETNMIGGGAAKMYPLGSFGALPEDSELSASDQALLAAYGNDNGAALSALEAANVAASRGAFGGLQGTVVNPEQLMGFGALDAAVVAAETLGEGGQYPGYLA